jgi:hypothetical protein
MYKCYVCGAVMVASSKLKAHLFRRQECAELKLPILCCQVNCKASFTKVNNLMKHMNRYHGLGEGCSAWNAVPSDSSPALKKSHGLDSQDENWELELPGDTDESISPMDVDESIILEDIHVKAVTMVASLRANSSVPYNVIPEIIESVNNVTKSVVDCVLSVTNKSMLDMGISCEIALSVTADARDKLDPRAKPLQFLSSVWKQDKYFENHELFVKPETVDIRPRFETHGGTSRLVYDSFQYVSVERTLQTLLRNQSFVEALLDDEREPGVYFTYADGSRAKEHPVWQF